MCMFHAGTQALHISWGHSLEEMMDKKVGSSGVTPRESSLVRTGTDFWPSQGEGFFGTESGAGAVLH